MSGDPGHFIQGALRHEDTDVAKEYRTAMCTVWSLVEVNGRTLQSRGSGFLVRCAGLACVLTNAHVLPNRESLSRSKVKFIAPVAGQSSVVTLCPEMLFITSPKPRPDACVCKDICTCPVAAKASALALDYTVCAIQAEGLSFRKSVPVPLNGTKPMPGSGVFFIHQVGDNLRCCKEQVEYTEEFRILTMSTSFPGSSGSPVFNLDRELIGLHRAGGCKSLVPMEAMPANVGIGKVIAPCLAVPARAIARNMRLQLGIRDLLDDILDSFLSDGASSESAADDATSSSDDDAEWAHYTPQQQQPELRRPPRFLLSKWGFEVLLERSSAGSQLTVTRILPDTQAASRLEVGDVIHAVNGTAVGDLEIVVTLTLLQVTRLSLAVDRLSPSVGFLTLLAVRRRVEVQLDTPQLMRGGLVHASEQDPQFRSKLEARTGAETAGNQSAASGEGGASSDEGGHVTAPQRQDSAPSGPGGVAGTEGGEGAAAVVDGAGGVRLVVGRLGVELRKSSPGRLRVAQVWKQSWCRAVLRRHDEVLAIGGRGLLGMKVPAVLELLNREGVRVMLARRAAAGDASSEEVWTVELRPPPADAEGGRPMEGKGRKRQRRRRVREFMCTRHGQSPAVYTQDEVKRRAQAGSAEPGASAVAFEDEEAQVAVVERWGLELERSVPGRLRVRTVREGSLARGRVLEGDDILAVNRRSIRGMRVPDVVEAMSVGLLTLAVEREGAKGVRGVVVVELHALKLAPRAPRPPCRPDDRTPSGPPAGLVLAGAIGNILHRAAAAADNSTATLPAPPPGIRIERWGLQLERGRPGALRVCGVSGRAAGGQVRVGDVVVRVNQRALKGMSLAEVEEMFGWERPELVVERAVRRPALVDYWTRETLTVRLGRAPEVDPEALQALVGAMVTRMVDSALSTAFTCYLVQRWGLQLGKGSPGRLRVVVVGEEAPAAGRLLEGDEIVAVQGRSLQGMRVADVIRQMQTDRVALSVHRSGTPNMPLEVELSRTVMPRTVPAQASSAEEAKTRGQHRPKAGEPSSAADVDCNCNGVDAGAEGDGGGVGGGRVRVEGEDGDTTRLMRSCTEADEAAASTQFEEVLTSESIACEVVDQIITRAHILAQQRTGVSGELRLPRWGLELARSLPGRLKICRVRGRSSAGFGRVFENDDIIAIRGVGLKGSKLSDVLAALNRSPLQLTVERSVGGDGGDYWQRAVVDAVLVDAKQPHDPEPPTDAETAAAEAVDCILARVAQWQHRTFRVERWGLEVRRGAPGRLRVCSIRSDSLAGGRLLLGDQVTAVNGTRLGSMPVGDALVLLESEAPHVTVERSVARDGARNTETVTVELQGWPRRFNANPSRILGSAIEGMCNSRAVHKHDSDSGQNKTPTTEPAAPRFAIARWGLELSRGPPGSLGVNDVKADGPAGGLLFAGDEIVAVDGREFKGMKVERVLQWFESELPPSLTITRSSGDRRQRLRVKLASTQTESCSSRQEPPDSTETTESRRPLSASEGVVSAVLGAVLDHAIFIASTRAQAAAASSSTAPASFSVHRWGLVLALGGPGRMSVLRSETMLGRSPTWFQEGDLLLLLNGRGLHGRKVAEVLAMLDVETLRVTLERKDDIRAGWSRHTLDLQRPTRQEVHPSTQQRSQSSNRGRNDAREQTDRGQNGEEDVKVRRQREARDVALQVIEEMVQGVVQTYEIARWGVVLRRGLPGRLKVCHVKPHGVASGRLEEGDEVVAVNGKALRGLRLSDALGAMDTEQLLLTVERKGHGAAAPLRRDVPLRALQSLASMVKISVRALNGDNSTYEHADEYLEARKAVSDVISDMLDAAVVRHAVDQWGLVLRRGSPGRLTVCTVDDNSAACGLLHVGDEIVAVNGRTLRGGTVGEALMLLGNKRVTLSVGDGEKLSRTVELAQHEVPSARFREREVTVKSSDRVVGMLNDIAHKVSATTAQLGSTAAHSGDEAVPNGSAGNSKSLCGEGLQLVRSSPGVLTVQKVSKSAWMWRDLMDGDEIVAVNGQRLSELTTSEVRHAMVASAPTITVHRRILNPPGTTFWKWMLPAQILSVRLPRAEADEDEAGEDSAAHPK